MWLDMWVRIINQMLKAFFGVKKINFIGLGPLGPHKRIGSSWGQFEEISAMWLF